MRPGQKEPNELEFAILNVIATGEPEMRPFLEKLHVMSREYTGVGSFTYFRVEPSDWGPERVFSPTCTIRIPGMRIGLAFALRCQGSHPEILEIFAHDEEWDGVYDGFTIE